MHEYIYETEGVCASRIHLAIEDGILVRAWFEDGCDGNSQGLCKLVEGMPVTEIIQRLKGITCDGKATSCPDQLTRALEKIIARRCV